MQREHAREQGTHQLSAATAQDVTTELFVLLRCVRETRRRGEEAVAFAASERVLVDELPQFVSVIGNRRAEKQRRMAALGQVAKSLAYVASSKATLTLTLALNPANPHPNPHPHPNPNPNPIALILTLTLT